jgi:PPOX class probable F420-dependent enzyme
MATDVRGFDSLAPYKQCSIATFRRNGQRVNTPVWFGLEGGKIYVATEDPSGKVKRIRNDPRVEVAACTLRGGLRGAWMPGTARLLPPEETPAAEQAVARRYGLGRKLFLVFYPIMLRVKKLEKVYLEIAPRVVL